MSQSGFPNIVNLYYVVSWQHVRVLHMVLDLYIT
jgi:hypothetical protein